ncbi:forespore capture DNA-binding protein RefZ [Alkalihalobacillus sp. LMS39]|uniref:forespore capture DNA-binding protein RefZ n=1 Tax=Alkalihalobacillus sp. LMS39 TaxID=2924032 RepID=UPI001FB562F9|nr:forespore capture DNA-binding protein RefZ [Alkalihalobacillus sp. LMS39]UOE93459.1 forespore capture DNA-binding protein RefZ [Alkalihalobacillus sp. LMS39]
MKSDKDGTKQKVIDAAISLFNVQGYSGTSIRNICERADVNPALVSYYFGGKKGLLEHLMTSFFEDYLNAIEQQNTNGSARDLLIETLRQALYYQQSKHDIARFVHREITLDTMLVREVMSTYLMKEKHVYYEIIKKGMDKLEFKKQPIDFIIIQIRGMVTLPFLHPQYIREVHHLIPHEEYFILHYIDYLTTWIDQYLCERHTTEESLASS